MTWIRNVKEGLILNDPISMESWGSASLAHLYRALCRATRFDCKEIDDPLTLLHIWTWIRMSFLTPILGFVWEVYGIDRIEAVVIPEDVRSHLEIWSVTVPLILFETLKWYTINRCRRQFGFVQSIPHQERSLDDQHGEVLTRPKNLEPVPLHHPLDLYINYREKYGTHLHLSDMVLQEYQECDAMLTQPHQPEPQPLLRSL
ncbi:hypothetical protein Ahy_B02g060555 [Arachis hypogaea]|uniref:Aminotransferase-like plant mobile domain-containing protein n=1 Tax=Arachis hypogaea TaxID=3818 RepID=A0A445AIU6_ARAHY|nr:hypothetical protein Ahy_B02g060555 [Arachis hypogaea]